MGFLQPCVKETVGICLKKRYSSNQPKSRKAIETLAFASETVAFVQLPTNPRAERRLRPLELDADDLPLVVAFQPTQEPKGD